MLLSLFYFSVKGRVTETSMVVSRGLKTLAQQNLKNGGPNWTNSFKTCVRPSGGIERRFSPVH